MKWFGGRGRDRRAAFRILILAGVVIPLLLIVPVTFTLLALGFSREVFDDWQFNAIAQTALLPFYWLAIRYACRRVIRRHPDLQVSDVARLTAIYYLAFDILVTAFTLIASFSIARLVTFFFEAPAYTAVMYFATKRYLGQFKHSEKVIEKKKSELKGLRGWLLLITFSLSISPFLLGYQLVDLLSFFADGMWQRYFDSTSGYYNPLLAAAVIYEIVGYALLTGFTIYVVYLLYARKKSFPKTAVVVYVANAIFLFADLIITILLVPAENVSAQDFLTALTGVSIWVPYLLISRRVKNTFVN